MGDSVLTPQSSVPSAASLAERLAAEVGAGVVETSPARLAEVAVDGAVPSVLVTAATREQVGRAIAVAEELSAAVIPRGSGTHVHIGNPPRRYDIALSCRGLRRVLAHDAGDMTVAVEAGVTLDELAAVLRSAGQWLPLDPPRPEEVTAGGLLAADLNGGLRFSHGKARDYLIGARAVVGAGTLVRGGGSVVKNVAGYDLPKLLVGSFGSLGAIVEATFKVRPLPAADAWFAAPCATLADAASRALSLLDERMAPYALDVCDAATADEIGLPARPHALLRLGGEVADVNAQRDRLATLLPGCDAIVLGAAARGFGLAAPVSCLLGLLPGDLAALVAAIEVEARSFGVAVRLLAHAGSGVARVCLEAEPAPLPFLRWLRFAARQRGGHLRIERLPLEHKREIDVWGEPTAPLDLFRRVKEALDPRSTFSPGRFVGGL